MYLYILIYFTVYMEKEKRYITCGKMLTVKLKDIQVFIVLVFQLFCRFEIFQSTLGRKSLSLLWVVCSLKRTSIKKNFFLNQMGSHSHFAHLRMRSIKSGSWKYIINMYISCYVHKVLDCMHKTIYIYIQRHCRRFIPKVKLVISSNRD